MSAYAPEVHPFQPGDRVVLPGPPSYGFTRLFGRVHYVERVWSEPDRYYPMHYMKLIGFEKPVGTGRFRLVRREKTVSK